MTNEESPNSGRGSTHIATVDPDAVSIVKSLESSGKINVQVIIASIIRRPNPIQILKKVLVDVLVKWWRCLNLIIHGRMEIQRSADNVENLRTKVSLKAGGN